jgi:hypothetical protein
MSQAHWLLTGREDGSSIDCEPRLSMRTVDQFSHRRFGARTSTRAQKTTESFIRPPLSRGIRGAKRLQAIKDENRKLPAVTICSLNLSHTSPQRSTHDRLDSEEMYAQSVTRQYQIGK